MAARKPRRAKRTTAPKRARGKTTPTRKTAGARTFERRRQERETLRLRSLEPSLTVDDLNKSLHFYTEVLGFFRGRAVDRGRCAPRRHVESRCVRARLIPGRLGERSQSQEG
jgi:hypothetical protein